MVEVPVGVRQAADAFGLDAASLRSVGRSGSSWTVGDRVLRVGSRPGELVASSAAAAVVPVPRVLDEVELETGTAVLLERLPGVSAAEFVAVRPDQAKSVGRSCGALHALFAEVRAPSELPGAPGARSVPDARLLHLDLHPFNVLVGDRGEITGVIDWANAAAGDPVLDCARSWTILTLDPGAVARRANPAWATLTQEWIRVGGLHDIPAAARAWACKFMLQDLRQRYPPTAMKHVSQILADAESKR
jgi:Phosphotransferase enzyme family